MYTESSRTSDILVQATIENLKTLEKSAHYLLNDGEWYICPTLAIVFCLELFD